MKRLLKGAAWAVGGLIALALVAAGVGLLLPEAHHASVQRVVAGTPEAVWTAITDVEGMSAWRPGLDRAERLPPRDGLPVWRESGPTGTMTLQVTELQAPRRMVTRIADEGLPFGGTWTYVVEPEGDGSRVTLTEDGEIHNPLFRFVARYLTGYEGTMTAYLDGLAARMSGP